jgi:hypothetical protein
MVAAAGCGTGGAQEAQEQEARDAQGWQVTVYYTAVEEHHGGPVRPVRGCRQLECAGGDDDLGTYPGDFIDAVEAEGTGRITSGPHAGRYLNWSHDVGFWLDTAPRDSHGGELRPFSSAAADADVLAEGTEFRVADCGRADDGSEPPPGTCRRFREASWRVVDEFTPGLGGDRHVDLYVGEESGPGFVDGDLYVSLERVELTMNESP